MTPIRPENKHRYPPDWQEIREAILRRADSRCEWCGAKNYEPHPVTGSKVVLTIAHLDHTPENNEESNLRALCQRCHNRYDAPVRAARRRERLRAEFMRIQPVLEGVTDDTGASADGC